MVKNVRANPWLLTENPLPHLPTLPHNLSSFNVNFCLFTCFAHQKFTNTFGMLLSVILFVVVFIPFKHLSVVSGERSSISSIHCRNFCFISSGQSRFCLWKNEVILSNSLSSIFQLINIRFYVAIPWATLKCVINTMQFVACIQVYISDCILINFSICELAVEHSLNLVNLKF